MVRCNTTWLKEEVSFFHMKITASVTKSLYQDCGPCYSHILAFFLFKCIDLGIKLDSNKYEQKLPHIYGMTEWMANNHFLS